MSQHKRTLLIGTTAILILLAGIEGITMGDASHAFRQDRAVTISPAGKVQIPNTEPRSFEATYKFVRSPHQAYTVKVRFSPPRNMRLEKYQDLDQESLAAIRIFNGKKTLTYFRDSARLDIRESMIDREEELKFFPLWLGLAGTPFATGLSQELHSKKSRLTDEGVVCGRSAYVVEKRSSQKTHYRLWFDKETLLLLRSEIYTMSADGSEQLRKSQECVQVNYDVDLDESLFTKPAVSGASVTHRVVRPASRQVFRRLPFNPLSVSEVPNSLTLDSAYVVTRTVSDVPEENTALVIQGFDPIRGSDLNLVIQQRAVGTPSLPGSGHSLSSTRCVLHRETSEVDVNGHVATLTSFELPRRDSRGRQKVRLLRWTQDDVRISMEGKGIARESLLAIARSMSSEPYAPRSKE